MILISSNNSFKKSNLSRSFQFLNSSRSFAVGSNRLSVNVDQLLDGSTWIERKISSFILLHSVPEGREMSEVSLVEIDLSVAICKPRNQWNEVDSF